MAFVIIKELVANNHIITRPEEYDTQAISTMASAYKVINMALAMVVIIKQDTQVIRLDITTNIRLIKGQLACRLA